jgi:hypothetical protein
MTIDFNCVKCEGAFELDSQDLIDGTEKLECPHCNTKAAQAQVDDFVAALTELTAQVATISKKFTMNMAIESEDLEVEKEDEEEDEEEDVDDDDEDDDDEDEEDDDEAEEEDAD